MADALIRQEQEREQDRIDAERYRLIKVMMPSEALPLLQANNQRKLDLDAALDKLRGV